MSKIIITCAITGSIHTPTMSDALPFRAKDIAQQAIDAAAAGASVLHLHARDPDNGHPSSSTEHFMAFLPQIKAQSNAIVNMTTGGSAIMTLDQRLAAPMQAEPEMCSLNMGSMNFALYPMAARYSTWKFNWEKPFLDDSDDLVFKNTPKDISGVLERMGVERNARFEFECYDTGHLTMLKHFVDRGLVKTPVFLQFVFGVLGGMAPSAENLTHMKRLADQYFEDDYQFSVLAAGRHQMPLALMGAGMGGHVRVGLEDSLYISRGVLAKSNAQQVSKIRQLVEGLGREVATPDDVRAMLGLKGVEHVRF